MVRGSGKQKIGALVNLGAYYLVGVPLGVVIAFVYHGGGKVTLALIFSLSPTCHLEEEKINPFEYLLGTQGLWTGVIVSLFVQTISLAIVILCTNWEKEV